jgi:ABC-2 type transport system permease protein
MNALPTLVRRELWEHKALWITPLVVAGMILLSVLLPNVRGDGMPGMRIDGRHFNEALSEQTRIAVFGVMQWALTIPQYLVMMIVLFFYAIDCLYAERKDRSILFWKSMPVSDAATVLSKLLVALIVVPLGVYGVALVTDLVAAGILQLRFPRLMSMLMAWDTGVWLQVQGLMLLGLIVGMLWYAPLVAYLLLLSAWARRNVFLWTVLPPVLAAIVERIAFNTDFVTDFIEYRLGGIWGELGVGKGLGQLEGAEKGKLDIQRVLDTIDAGSAFANVDLWLGLLAAAALIWGAVRIRRFRDDT